MKIKSSERHLIWSLGFDSATLVDSSALVDIIVLESYSMDSQITNKPFLFFQAEWEALELVSHHWALQDVEEQLISQDLKLTGMSRPDWALSVHSGVQSYGTAVPRDALLITTVAKDHLLCMVC